VTHICRFNMVSVHTVVQSGFRFLCISYQFYDGILDHEIRGPARTVRTVRIGPYCSDRQPFDEVTVDLHRRVVRSHLWTIKNCS
jgi:hypothetical protein